MGDHKNPSLAVDVIIEKQGRIVLVKRKFQPFMGKWAFPGGFVNYGETVEAAAMREAKEETGLEINLKSILGVYSDPATDPRGHVAAVVFIADVFMGTMKANDDAEDIGLFSFVDLNPSELAFDHGKRLMDYLNWKRKGSTYWSSKQ